MLIDTIAIVLAVEAKRGMSTPSIHRRSVLKHLGGTALAAGALAGTASAHPDGLQRELAAVRSATAKYNNPRKAYADGYVAFDHDGNPVPLEDVVDDAESVCGMGYHFGNFDLLGETNPLRPQVLVYGTSEGGQLVLGAVEYIVPDALPGNPDFFEHDDGDEVWVSGPFSGVQSLHVWVHTHNPDGVFSHFNPRKLFSPEGCESH